MNIYVLAQVAHAFFTCRSVFAASMIGIMEFCRYDTDGCIIVELDLTVIVYFEF